jgi:dolichol kinase
MAHSRCSALAAKVAVVRKNMSDRQRALTVALENILNNLQSYLQELEGSPNSVRLRQKFQALSLAYEDLVVQCRRMKNKARDYGHFSHLKPSNYARNLFHVLMGVTATVLYQFFLDQSQGLMILTSLTLLAVVLETGRRFSPKFNRLIMDTIFKPISRPREENHMNSGTFYLLGLTLITFCFPKTSTLIGVLILTFADPAAALVGKKWGKKKLWRDKSYVGTLGFFVTAFVVSFVYLVLASAETPFASKLVVSLSVASVGSFAELFSEYLDDNFTIPVLCAGVAALQLLP